MPALPGEHWEFQQLPPALNESFPQLELSVVTGKQICQHPKLKNLFI